MSPTNATTDSDTGLRFYEWRGQKLLSVTSLRRIIGMPFPLAAWQVNQAIAAAINNSTVLDQMVNDSEGEPIEAARIAGAAKFLRKQTTMKRDKSADLGIRVHEAADKRVDASKAEPEVSPFLRQFYDAEGSLGLIIAHSEKQVFNPTLGYAGTLDLLGYRGPIAVLGDLKTGEHLYVEHLIQLLLYAMAEVVGENDVIDVPATKFLHNVQELAILHLRPTEWEWVIVDPTIREWTAAQSMIDLAVWFANNPDIKPHIKSRVSGSA